MTHLEGWLLEGATEVDLQFSVDGEMGRSPLYSMKRELGVSQKPGPRA